MNSRQYYEAVMSVTEAAMKGGLVSNPELFGVLEMVKFNADRLEQEKRKEQMKIRRSSVMPGRAGSK